MWRLGTVLLVILLIGNALICCAFAEGQYTDISNAERDAWISGVSQVNTSAVTSKIDVHGNMPAMMVNGKPLSPQSMYFGYLNDDWGFKLKDKSFHELQSKRLVESGIHVYQTDIVIELPSGRVDLSRADTQIAGMLAYDPSAIFFIRVAFRCREDFAKKYSSDVVVFDDGSLSHYTRPNVALLSSTSTPRYSLASRVWEREAAKGLINMAKRLASTSYNNRIAGFMIGGGAYSQWLWWNDFDNSKYSIDYSPAMQSRFAEYVKAKYKTEEALKKAWGDPQVSFSNIKLPTPQEKGTDIPSSCNEGAYKMEGNLGYFYDPGKAQNQKIIDYYTCVSAELGDRVIYLCRALKQAYGGNMLVGALYSPLSILGYHSEGQSYFRDVLNSPWVDFWAYPWTYEGRAEGENIFFNSPVSSQLLRNKPAMIECDLRTSLTGARAYGAPLDANGDLMNMRKSFARNITYGSYGYWYEMRPGWYDNAQIFQALKEASEIGDLSLNLDRRRNAEIAVIYDQESLFYASEWLDFLTIVRQTIQEMGYIGADYDIYEMDDISRPEMSKYKLYIFPNAFALNDKERKAIKDNLQKNNKTILWCYAPGLINPDQGIQLAVSNMPALTGMDFAYNDGRHNSQQKVTDSSNAITKGLPADFTFGDFVRPITTGHGCTPEKPLAVRPVNVYPQFYVNDAKATALAKFVDTGKIGLAVKNMGNWTSVYCGSMSIPSSILRAIACRAGVNIYSDNDDIVYTNNNLLGIHTSKDGERIIKLPKTADVYDLFEKKLVAKKVSSFKINLPKYSTALYFIGDYDQLKAKIQK
jgi:hypothetical protein